MPTAPNAKNLIIHRGSHPKWDTYVARELIKEMKALAQAGLHKMSPKAIEDIILRVEKRLRKAVEERTVPPSVLKELHDNGLLKGVKLGALDIQTGKEGAYT